MMLKKKGTSMITRCLLSLMIASLALGTFAGCKKNKCCEKPHMHKGGSKAPAKSKKELSKKCPMCDCEMAKCKCHK